MTAPKTAPEKPAAVPNGNRKHADATALVPHQPPTLQKPPASVIIRGFDDLARFAVMVDGSGWAPKGMNVQGIGVAIQFGLELGLAPMQALQSVAVINGRPGIYGDAAKALVEGSGLMEEYRQWFEVGGKKLTTADGHPRTPTAAELAKDDCTCCVLSRRAGRESLVTTFSVSDAKAANLWKKAGPWTQYPARMLMFRARGFNLRDNFADVLRGMRTVEELHDQPVDAQTAATATADRMAALRERIEAAQQPPAGDPESPGDTYPGDEVVEQQSPPTLKPGDENSDPEPDLSGREIGDEPELFGEPETTGPVKERR